MLKRRSIVVGLVALAGAGAVAVAAVCGDARTSDDAGSVPPSPTAGSSSAGQDRRSVQAPIDEADIVVRESFPPQYAVRVVSGLPSGCAEFEGYETARSGATITVKVTNTVPADPMAVCTAIYGMHEGTVELGSDFTSGITYLVTVNDRTLTFVAE
jgi:hypothetical protein